MTENRAPIISFRDFSFRYNAQKRPTLKHINLDIFPGEKVLILGPSGCGKSTLGNCINGLIPESYQGEAEGTLTVCGLDAPRAGIFALSAHVGTVLQDPDGQFIGLTVGEDIAFSLENDCVAEPEMKKAVSDAATLVGAENLLESAPHELSGGQKQRVSLAGVLVGNVDILLFDEPLANLDPATGKQTIELIDSIQADTGTTVVIIEHRLEDVLWRHVDRIILMREGQIAADMASGALLATTLLPEAGIREPLYVTALRYANLPLRRDMSLDTPHALALTQDDRNSVRAWYEAAPEPAIERSEEEALRVNRLSFSYAKGSPALSDVSFSVMRGEMVAIAGQNGAGKSTLAKLICGFETPESGDIFLFGKNAAGTSIRERAKRVGYVMQDPNQMLSKPMIIDEVALGLRGMNLTDAQVREKVDETLKICGLYPFRAWPVSALSFGQKKRVTIASVLVMGCEIIILDEPTAGQDFRHYTEIMEFLKSLAEQGVTVLMITHDMHLMLEYTPRALVFAGGHLLADTSAPEALCDEELARAASLKETSLFRFARDCGIPDATSYIRRFIARDREERS